MFISALEWSVKDAKTAGKPAVMSMSLGGERSELLDSAGRAAAEAGYAVVSASGNEGTDSCGTSPGADPAVISVGAINEADQMASYSNYGACTTLFAPGSDITGAWTSSETAAATLSGTSMATPHVAGAVAQLLQLFPKHNAHDVQRSLACMATENVVRGLDDYSPNRFLHTGDALWVPENYRLLKMQSVPSSRGKSAPTVTAFGCYRGGHGASKGHTVPKRRQRLDNADNVQ